MANYDASKPEELNAFMVEMEQRIPDEIFMMAQKRLQNDQDFADFMAGCIMTLMQHNGQFDEDVITLAEIAPLYTTFFLYCSAYFYSQALIDFEIKVE